jgi:methylenetetrahydrofolate--tRNA-(uracil-5-)-methyltransferase
MPRLRFAGQITGVEGYVESAAIGLLAGRFAAAEALGQHPSAPPLTTALGALLAHITGGHIIVALADAPLGSLPEGARALTRSFQPMNINYGLIPDLEAAPVVDASGKKLKGPERGRAKKQAMSRRAIADLMDWLGTSHRAAAE